MEDYAILSSKEDFTIFSFRNQIIRFRTASNLERYIDVLEWDHGYIVVTTKYKNQPVVEEYLDLIPILRNLYMDTETFLEPIKKVRVQYG